MSTSTQILDNTSSACQYNGGWFLTGTWQASNGQSGTLASTNDNSASVTFTFPVAATAFRYYGMKRSHGGKYGICVDCDPNNPTFTTIDAFDPTDNGQNPPSLLFQKSFSSPSVHVVILHNKADDRGTPAGNSQLTLDRFELDVPVAPVSTAVVSTTVSVRPPPQTSPTKGGDSDTSPTTVAATTAAPTTSPTGSSNQVSPPTSGTLNSSSLPASSSSITLGQSSQSLTASTTSVPPSIVASSGLNSIDASSQTSNAAPTMGASHTTSLGVIIGSALGGLAAIALTIMMVFWLRIKKRSASTSPSVRPLDMASATGTSPTPVVTATPGWTTGYGVGTFEKGHRPQQVSFSSRPSDSPASLHPASSRSRLPRSPSSATASGSASGALENANSDSSNASNSSRTPRGRARREQDAGPVPQDLFDDDDNNDGETLPPDYRQVFNDRMSGRASQRSRPTPSSPPPPLPTSSPDESPLPARGPSFFARAFQPVRRS